MITRIYHIMLWECSLRDDEIPSQHLIQLWIGKGFLDKYDNIQETRNQGA